MFMAQKRQYQADLLKVLGREAKTTVQLHSFLRDLLTPSEYNEIITRWQIVKALNKGLPQREIAKKLNVSIAKVSRGSRVLLNKRGGFQTALKKIRN